MIEDMARKAGCTELQIETLRALAEGETISSIARRRGVTRRGVQRTRDAAFARIKRGASNPPTETSRQAQARALKAQGHSTRFIARMMGISQPRVVQLCKPPTVSVYIGNEPVDARVELKGR